MLWYHVVCVCVCVCVCVRRPEGGAWGAEYLQVHGLPSDVVDARSEVRNGRHHVLKRRPHLVRLQQRPKVTLHHVVSTG
jgi:hypothetical protein